MEAIGDAKDVATSHPFAVAIPSKQGIVLMSRDSPSSSPHSRSQMFLCPAYRICRQSRGPYRSPMLDSHHDQQLTTLRDSLQAIKESARLIQLIANDIEKRQRPGADSWSRYPDLRYERIKQSPSSPASGLIATTSSICALCGVALQLKDSSEESRKFVVDKKKHDDHDILSKYLGNILKMAYKVPSPTEKAKDSDNFSITGSVFDHILPQESDSMDKRAKGREKGSSKTQSTDTSESISEKPKLLFIRQTPSGRITYETHQDDTQRSASQMPRYVFSKREYKTSDLSNHCIDNISSQLSSMQDASTFTQDVLCPCTCGLLMSDGLESEVSINSMPTLKDTLVKTKLEELSFHLESRETSHTKVYDDVIEITKTKMQKLRKDIKVKEIVQLRLQMQIDELNKNIQFFKQENEYIRHLAEKCRCLSEDIHDLQQLLPISETHSGFTTTIQHLQARYYNEHGIIATLIGMFRGSINIQQIVTRLLAPILEHWNPRDNIITTDVSSAPRPEASLTPSSRVFSVY